MTPLSRRQPETHGKEYYACEKCGEKFRQKYNYNLHVKKCLKKEK